MKHLKHLGAKGSERALDILYNSHTYALLVNPDSGLQLQSDAYILTSLLRELEM